MHPDFDVCRLLNNRHLFLNQGHHRDPNIKILKEVEGGFEFEVLWPWAPHPADSANDASKPKPPNQMIHHTTLALETAPVSSASKGC